MDSATQQQFEKMKVKDVHELLALDMHTLAERLVEADLPTGEKLIGAVMLSAAGDLRTATADVAASSRQIDRGTKNLITLTKNLITLAQLTLAIAIVSLVVALVALGKSL
jgi:hypothetical protein